MSEPSPKNDKPQIEIAADEDWKSRVKAEDARLDAELAADAVPAGTTTASASDREAEGDVEQELDSGEIPPASLFTLLQMLSTQSIVALGMIPAPNGKTTVQLPVAKHFIDLLSMLETKCKGNLTADEQRFLEGTLHELRMTYVEVSRKQS